jgi:hypothetical protein
MQDLDEMTADNVSLDISAILDDFEPPPAPPSSPSFVYTSSGAPGECGDGWFLVLVIRNDGTARRFRVTVEAVGE